MTATGCSSTGCGRGVSRRDRAALDLWLKEAAPSPELRTEWHAHPERWDEFSAAYRAELATNPAVEALVGLAAEHPRRDPALRRPRPRAQPRRDPARSRARVGGLNHTGSVPELPEVQALVTDLGGRLIGRVVDRVDVVAFSALKTYDPPLSALAGGVVRSVSRHGKFLDLGIETTASETLHLVIHLARAGWIRWRPARPGPAHGSARAQPARGPARAG